MGQNKSSHLRSKLNRSGTTDEQAAQNLNSLADQQKQVIYVKNPFQQGTIVENNQYNSISPEQKQKYYHTFLSYFNSYQNKSSPSDKQNSLKAQAIQYIEMIQINHFDMPEPNQLIINYQSKNMSQIPLYEYFKKYKFYQYLKQNQGVSSIQKQSDENAQQLKLSELQIKSSNYDIKQCGKDISLYILNQSQIIDLNQSQIIDKMDNYNHRKQSSQVNLLNCKVQNKQQLNDENNKENNPKKQEKLEKILQHLAFTGQKYFYYSLPLQNSKKFNSQTAQSNKEQFGQYVKELLTVTIYPNLVSPEKILIVEVIYDPLTANFLCDLELPGMTTKQMIQPIKINESYFDSNWNMTWNGGVDKRGQINGEPKDYYLPSNLYQGLGLNIVENYPKDGWFGAGHDDKTWIILYHKQADFSIDPFDTQNQLRSSQIKYSGDECRFGRGLVGSGMYLADKIENCLSYGNNQIQIGDKKYEFIYQCRVNPKTIKSPKTQPNLFVVNNPKDIRPYRLLIRQIN